MGTELVLGSWGPLWIAAGRVCLAALLVLGVAMMLGDGLPGLATRTQRRIWLHCIGMGLFTNAFPFSLLAWGQQQVTSSFAGISMAVMPLLVLPLSHIFVPGERLTAPRLAGFAVGFAGVVLLIGGGGSISQIGSGMFAGGPSSGQIACLLACSCYAIGSIITRLSPPVSPLSFSAAGLLCAGVTLLPVAIMFEGAPASLDAVSFGGLVYLALLSTATATIILTVLVSRAGPPFVSLVNYQVPIWAVFFGLLILGEEIPGHFIPALALILSGLAIAQLLHGRAARQE